MPIRIVLTDDHPIVINGIKEMLKKVPEFDVIAEYNNGRSLLQSSLLSSTDVLILDLNMPHVDGLQVLERIKPMALSLKIIVVTAYLSPKLSEQCKEMGAAAYLVKTEDLESLKEVILGVYNGETFFADIKDISENELNDKYYYLDTFLKKYKLTKREVEIIQLLCNGNTSAEIAELLFLSVFTVQTHRKNINRKLNLVHSDNLSLYHFAKENGLV